MVPGLLDREALKHGSRELVLASDAEYMAQIERWLACRPYRGSRSFSRSVVRAIDDEWQ